MTLSRAGCLAGFFLTCVSSLDVPIARASVADADSCAADVVESLRTMSRTPGSRLLSWTNKIVPGRFYTKSPLSGFGFNNHFQGIQRLPGSHFMVLTGANLWKGTGQLFIIQMESLPAHGPFGSNLSRTGTGQTGEAPKEDRFIGRIDIRDPKHWHAGGMGRLGRLISVPLEGAGASSRVLFFDFTDPEKPVQLPVEIYRPDRRADYTSLASLSDGRLLSVVGRHSSLDFYQSNSHDILDGFEMKPFASWRNPDPIQRKPETVQLVRQCDGRLFLLSFDNVSKLAPILNGPNVLTAFEITNAKALPSPDLRLEKREEFQFDCEGYCNFSAASGVMVQSDGQLRVYSAPHYRSWTGKTLKMTEF